ncbi:MAG: hypothetical protein M3512_15805 [Bacteroidota bacterium]|nr:hypothetical protein [Bacteroidota bacterium]
MKALELIKEKGIFALKGAPQILIGDYKKEEMLLALKSLVPGFENKVTLLIHDITQLYDFVGKIPEIAWDIVDFAEDPLDVIYPAGKNVSSALLRNNGGIRIRLVKEGELFKVLKLYRKAFFCIAVAKNELIDKIPFQEVEIKDFKLSSKIILLEMNGEIRFLPN